MTKVEVAFVDQGYIGDEPAEAAQQEGIELQVIKLPEAKKDFMQLPRFPEQVRIYSIERTSLPGKQVRCLAIQS